jgi:hypothetical protein
MKLYGALASPYVARVPSFEVPDAVDAFLQAMRPR